MGTVDLDHAQLDQDIIRILANTIFGKYINRTNLPIIHIIKIIKYNISIFVNKIIKYYNINRYR